MCDGGGELEADVEGEGGGVPGDVVQLVVVPRHAHAQPGHAPGAAATGGLLASHRGQHLHVTLAYSVMSYQLHTYMHTDTEHVPLPYPREQFARYILSILSICNTVVLILSLFPLN